MNLRELYKEKEIRDINTTVIDKREKSMEEILKNAQLEYIEWELLVKWLVGAAEEDETIEGILIKLEKIFCELDENFSKENGKEMQILVGELIYRYCQETEEERFPLMVLCGYNIGCKIKSEKMYKRFVHLVKEWRLNIRQIESQEEEIKISDAAKVRKIILAKQKKAEDEGLEWAADQEDWRGLLGVLVSYEKAIRSLVNKSGHYKKMLEVQREESDILWWILNEWSNIYNQSFRELKREQLALSAPIELHKMIPYDLGPFAVKQVLYKVMSLAQDGEMRMTLRQLVSTVDERLLHVMDFDDWYCCELQPVMLALCCKVKAGEEGWRSLFTRECKIDPDEVEMTLEEFTYQFYLELELAVLPVN